MTTTALRPLASLLAAAIALAAFASTASAQSASEVEARRQLDFARTELADGRYERAVSSAASALRLDPSLFEAMLVKGLAYEGSGDLRRADAMVLAHIELVGEAAASDEAVAAEQRIASRRRSGPAPIRAEVVERDGDAVLVEFVSNVWTRQAPRVHWRKPAGEWKSAPMLRGDAGWMARVQLRGGLEGDLQYRVEATDAPIPPSAPAALSLDGPLAAR